MRDSTRASLLGSVAVASWATVATAFKIALAQLSVYETIFIATLTALAIFAIQMTVSRQWSELRSLSRSDWSLLAVMGAVNPVAYYLILFQAYDLLPAQIAQPLNYAWPIVLLVLLALFRHKAIPPMKYVGMGVSLAGVVAISSGGEAIGGNLSPVGMGLAAGSAILWASYWMISDTLASRGVSQSAALFGGFLFGAIYLTLLLLLPAHWNLPVGIGTFNVPSLQALLAGVYVGCFEIGIPFICFGLAIRISPNPALINQMCYLSPFLSLALIATVLGEPIAPTTVIGLVLIVAGLVFNQYFVHTKPVNA